jgi:hypothetical protein
VCEKKKEGIPAWAIVVVVVVVVGLIGGVIALFVSKKKEDKKVEEIMDRIESHASREYEYEE